MYAEQCQNVNAVQCSIPVASDMNGPAPGTRCRSFVHLDVDLYAPTFDSLTYFYPRLSTGVVIICDDCGAPLFPGAHRAWDDFCEQHEVPYVVLDTGQSVIVKV